MTKKVVVIGAGFAGISVASCLAQKGYQVTVIEKNDVPGGRARKFEVEGFMFDMGPSWYWMPDVFDKYFNRFGKKVQDYYNLVRLDPGYCIFSGKNDILRVPAKMESIRELFETYEPGSSQALNKFLKAAAFKYQVGIEEFVYKPGRSITEFADNRIFKSLFLLQMFTPISTQIDKLFKHPKLRELLKFPVLFLGAKPEKIPAMYSLMNYADLALGTWYPIGGMYKIVEGMVSLAKELGVEFKLGETVKNTYVKDGNIKKVLTEKKAYQADVFVVNADYHHFEQEILMPNDRVYSKEYWNKRTMAPSSVLFYLGINKKLKNLQHHNLFFDESFKLHTEEIYDKPAWPSKPLFYVCCPSVTDTSCAPKGCENVFILIPVAPGLKGDDEATREHYYNQVVTRIERLTGQSIRDAVIYKRSYAHSNFKRDYNSFKGNAYGLANTLKQTSIFKPSIKSKKVKNLFYTGQLTNPGPGVPPAIISGQVVAEEVSKQLLL